MIAVNGLICAVLIQSVSVVTLVEKSSGLDYPGKENGKTEYELADVNGDGHLDIVSVGDHGSPWINSDQHGIMVWFGDGSGNWTVQQEGSFGYGGCALGDLNNDGIMDIAWGIHHDYGSGGFGDRLIGAALGNDTGAGWVPWNDGLAENGETYGMFAIDLADFNNDGLLDIVCQSFGASNGVRVYRNHGDGTWTQEWELDGWNANFTLETGDFNADGNMDFICTRWGSGINSNVYFGDGQFGFTQSQEGIPDLQLRAVDTGDFNNNGADDILVSMGSDSGVRVYSFNTAAGHWEDLSSGLPSGGTSYSMVQFGHMNGDEFLDVVVYSATLGQVYLGDGSGNWTADATFSYASPGFFSALRVDGDFDHDGREDIIVQAAEGSPYSYTNYLRAYSPWQEPSQLATRLVTPKGGETFAAGSARFVRWLTAVPPGLGQASIDLHLSTTGPDGPWEAVATGIPDNCRYQWTLPQLDSANCRMRITATAAGHVHQYISPADFSIVQGVGVSRQTASVPLAPVLTVSPNPAESAPVARVTGIEAGPAQLMIFDLAGRRINSLPLETSTVSEVLLAGRGNRPLPAGVYIVLVRTPAGDASALFSVLK